MTLYHGLKNDSARSWPLSDRIKIACAFALLICLLLPFSSCTRELDEDGKYAYISKKPVARVITEYYYTWEHLKRNDLTSWLFLGSFLWPVPLLACRFRVRRQRLARLLWLSEPLWVAGSVYFFYIESCILQSPAAGAFLAFAADGLYGAAWLSELIMRLRKANPHSEGLRCL